eukprot:2771924-Lingulodinium_polyedra.AAC.1
MTHVMVVAIDVIAAVLCHSRWYRPRYDEFKLPHPTPPRLHQAGQRFRRWRDCQCICRGFAGVVAGVAAAPPRAAA